MTDDDLTRADALRATSGDATGRRSVLGGVAAALGAALGLSGVAAARETGRPGPGEAHASASTRSCPPGCNGQFWCCEYEGSTCSEWCTLCDCE